MPNKNTGKSQNIAPSRKSTGSISRYVNASIESDVGKPTKERPRPVEKPEKKGE